MVTPLLVALVPNYLGHRPARAGRRAAGRRRRARRQRPAVPRRALVPRGRPRAGRCAAPRRGRRRSSRRASTASLLLIPDDLRAGGETRGYGAEVDATCRSRRRSTRRSTARERAHVSRVARCPPPLGRAFGGCAWAGVVPLRSARRGRGLAASPARASAPRRSCTRCACSTRSPGRSRWACATSASATRIAELAAEGERVAHRARDPRRHRADGVHALAQPRDGDRPRRRRPGGAAPAPDRTSRRSRRTRSGKCASTSSTCSRCSAATRASSARCRAR